MKASTTRKIRCVAAAGILTLLAACGPAKTAGSSDATAEISANVPTMAELYEGSGSAPPETGPVVAQDKTVWFISCGQKLPDCATMAAASEEAGAALGWNMRVFDGNLNVNGAFNEGIRAAIAANADAIVIAGMHCEQMIQSLREAKAAKIPVIGTDALDCNETGDENGEDLITVPMLYSEKAPTMVDWLTSWGSPSAAWLANNEPSAKVITVNSQDPLSNLLMAGFRQGVEQWCSECEILEELNAPLDGLAPDGLLSQRFQSALTKHSDEATIAWGSLDYYLGTLGMAKSIENAGLKDKVHLLGGSGAQASADLLRAGLLQAIPSARALEWPQWGALDELNRHFNGEESVPQGIGVQLADETKNMPPAGPYVEQVDFKSAYTTLWAKH